MKQKTRILDGEDYQIPTSEGGGLNWERLYEKQCARLREDGQGHVIAASEQRAIDIRNGYRSRINVERGVKAPPSTKEVRRDADE